MMLPVLISFAIGLKIILAAELSILYFCKFICEWYTRLFLFISHSGRQYHGGRLSIRVVQWSHQQCDVCSLHTCIVLQKHKCYFSLYQYIVTILLQNKQHDNYANKINTVSVLEKVCHTMLTRDLQQNDGFCAVYSFFVWSDLAYRRSLYFISTITLLAKMQQYQVGENL